MKANFNIAKNIRNSRSISALSALRKLHSLGLLLCALLFGSLQVWGATTTASFSPTDFEGQGNSYNGGKISCTKSPITVSCDKGYGYNEGQTRLYQNGYLSITSSAGNIKEIAISFTSSSYQCGLSTSYTGLSTTSWTSSRLSGKAARVTGITVTYEIVDACTKSVTVSDGGSSTHGSITSITTSPVATCSSTASDRQVSILVTPSNGYTAPEDLTIGTKTGTVTSTKFSRTDNLNGTFTFVYRYNQNDNGTISYNAACVAKTYTISLNDQDATTAASPTSITATFDSNTGLTGTVVTTLPTKTGYTFGGYYNATGGSGVQLINSAGEIVASASGGGKTYTDASKNWIHSGGVTVYAKWTEKALTNYRTLCSVTCDDAYCINSYKDGGNGMTCFTDQGSDVWTISNYAIPETGQSDRKAQNDFWVGYDGAWVSGKSDNWHFRWIPFKNLSCATYKLGSAPEAIGTLTINAATSGSDNNYELTFDPNGYGFVYGTDPSWETPLAFTRQGVSNVWNTAIVNVSDVISHSYYVGISKKGGGYVFSSDYDYNDDNEHIQGISQIQTINGVPVVSNTTSNPVAFRGSNLNATDGSNGMRGYFQIWTDNCNRNFYCHFVPVYTITYKSYDGSSTLYTEEVSAGESFTVRAAESGTLGWAESASQNAASVNYTAGATKTPTGDVTLYVACSAYTVSYTATSGTIQRDAVTISSDVVIAGNTVTLPTVTGSALTCAKFLGWYAGDYNNASKPAILAAGSTYEPTNDVTLKAIYAIVGDNYELVTSPSSLEVGSQVVFAYRGWDDDYDAYYPVAMSEKQLTNNRDVYDFTSSKVSLNADGTTISWTEDAPDVAEFTVEAGSSNGTYAFYAETVYDNNGDATDPGYIYCASGSSNGYLRTKSDKDALGSWTITISSGEATMVSGSAQTRKYLWYNPTNDVFCCYASNYDNNGGKKTSIFQRSVSNYTTSPACTTYSVSLCTPAPSNGTISASPTTVSPNGYTVVTFAPSSGYMLDAVTVTSGTADEPAAPVYSSGPTSGGTVRINNISSDITVCATFKAIPLYTVTFVDVDNGNATQTRTQASYGGSVTSPSTSSSSAHAPCDATWSFVGWAPSNTLSGETTEPTGFIAAGETIDGASITGATTYYSVYTNSSDGTTDFTPGKSGNYYLYALDGVTKHYATTWANATKLYDGYDNFATYPKSVLTLTYNSVTGKYKIYNTTIKQSDGSDKSGYFYQSINSSKDITVNEESNYTEFTITTGVADGSYRITYSYWANSVLKTGNFGYGSGFQGYAAGYDVYFEPATSLYYYNASSCTELVTMTFHPIAGGDPTWADGHPKAEYTDVAKGTISTFPTDSYDGWTFLGWTAGTSYNDNREGAGETLNEDNASATAPSQTIYSTGGNSYNLNADIDMYPVFTKFADNEPFDDINGGDYYIYYIADADIASSTDVYGATNRMYAATYGSYKYSATTSCANAALFTFTKLPNGKWTIYDNNNNGGTAVNPKHYLCGTASSNNLSLQATATAANYGEWNITVHNGNQFEAVSVDGQTFSASTTNALTGDFKNYDSDNLANGNKAQYHRIYLGSCTERVYSSDPSNQPRVEIHGTAKVTSTAGKNIKAASVLTVSAMNIATANLTVTSDNSAFKFSLTSNGTYTASVNIPVVSNKVGVTPIYVEYTPTATTDGIEGAIITVSDGAGTPTEVSTELGDVQGRHVPANFVIAAKWGDKWYALPANCTESTSSTTGVLIEVDNASNPTTATYAPTYTKWGLQTVRPGRKAEYGTRLVFTEQLTTATAEDQKTLYNGSTTSIQANAQYSGYASSNPDKYEWIPTSTDLKDYVLTSATTLAGDANPRTVSLSNKGVFGTLLINKSYDGKVRILPATFVEPAEMQVVEWKASSVVVMYTGSGTKAVTQLGDDDPSSAQSLATAKIDHGVFELTTGTLTSAKNEPLNITIQNGSDAIVGRKSFVVPAIVSGSQDAPLGLTSDEAPLTDVVILDEGVLSAVADKYTFKNITVYPGGKLVIGSGKQLGMASLTLRGGSSWGAATYEHKYPQFVVNNATSGAFSNSAAVINYDYVTTKDQYYSFVLPYGSNTKNVKYPIEIYGRALESGSQGSFEFQYYDGAARAAGEDGWKVLEEDPSTGADLVAGKGYTFLGMPRKIDAYDGTDNTHANTRQRYGIHRIPMSVAAATVQDGETNNKTAPLSVKLADKNNNSGWNLVGNPFMATLSGLSSDDIQVGKLVHTDTEPWDGKWRWDPETITENQRFVVIPGNDGQTYESELSSSATLPAFKNFFVQISKESADAISFSASNRALAPARYMDETEQDIRLAVDLVSEARKDKVDLLINDIYSAAFDQDGDFTKMMNTTNFNLYGVYPEDYLSFIAVDKTTAAGSIAIGYQVPAGGEYTLLLSDRAYVMTDAIEALYVTDHEVSPEVTTDLLDGPYNFTVNQAETNNTRFTVSIRLAPQTPTDIGNVPSKGMNADNAKPQKFIYHDKLYILRNGVIYDATGKKVK